MSCYNHQAFHFLTDCGNDVMDYPANASEFHVERFREYLCILARAQLGVKNSYKVDASDLVQETLLEGYQKLGQFRGRSDGELAAWLRQMLVHNLADAIRGGNRAKRDVRRERQLEVVIEDSFCRAESWMAAQGDSPSQKVIQIEELVRLARGLARLPDDQRQAVELHHLQGRTLAQLSEQLNRSNAAIAGLLRRGLKRLHELLEKPDQS